MLRITFPYVLFISLVSLSAGILNTWSRFAIPAFTPMLLNVAFITGALLFARRISIRPVLALAWAVFVGGVLATRDPGPGARAASACCRAADGSRSATRACGAS